MGNSNSTPDWEYTGDGGGWSAGWAGFKQGLGEFWGAPSKYFPFSLKCFDVFVIIGSMLIIYCLYM